MEIKIEVPTEISTITVRLPAHSAPVMVVFGEGRSRVGLGLFSLVQVRVPYIKGEGRNGMV
jgi:hypothetical protein